MAKKITASNPTTGQKTEVLIDDGKNVEVSTVADTTNLADPAPVVGETKPEAKPADPAPVVAEVKPEAEAKPADSAPLVATVLSDETNLAAKPANVLDFPGNQQAATDAQIFPPSQPLPPGGTPPEKETVGCQCNKCKESGGNKDKRGRHHATCPCNTCKAARGEVIEPAKPAEANPFTVVADTATDDNKKFAVLGEMSFDMGAGCLCMLFGQEWAPKTPEERAQVSTAIANYYKSKGVQDLPPGALLAVVLLAYGMPRLAHKNTQSKLQLAWAWTKVKVSGLFRRKSKLPNFNPTLTP